jgi:hypothetical protein
MCEPSAGRCIILGKQKIDHERSRQKEDFRIVKRCYNSQASPFTSQICRRNKDVDLGREVSVMAVGDDVLRVLDANADSERPFLRTREDEDDDRQNCSRR